jgi:hypothetical protein
MPAVTHSFLFTPSSDVTLEEPPLTTAGPYRHWFLRNIIIAAAIFAALVFGRLSYLWIRSCCLRRLSTNKYNLDRKSGRYTLGLLSHQQHITYDSSQRGFNYNMEEKSRGISNKADDSDEFILTGSLGTRMADYGDGLALGDYLPDETSPRTAAAVDGAAAFGSGSEERTATRMTMVRPPPPPPLTPPELFSAVFTLEDRRQSHPASVPELDTSFFQQPNPDYMSSTTSISRHSVVGPVSPSTSIPRRRSYTKTVPIGIPSGSPVATLDKADFLMSPSSHPSDSPLLPPPPPGHDEGEDDTEVTYLSEIEVQGEIISVLDDSGAGWKRHTRVYGGGVCLACAAAGGEGGFYGEKVRPEEKRHHFGGER